MIIYSYRAFKIVFYVAVYVSLVSLSLSLSIYIYIYINTHTHVFCVWGGGVMYFLKIHVLIFQLLVVVVVIISPH
jgi:hypothetical protein